MRAAVLVEPGRFEVREVPLPEPGQGEVRIKIEGCGVCASNIPPFEGREWFSYPMEPGGLGHEGWGVVDLAAPGTGFREGERVAFIGSHSYAEYEVAPANSLVRLPSSLKGRAFPGEPVGCALNILERAQVRSGDKVAIIGIGFLGSLLTRLCKNAGATVIAIARKPYALEVAEGMGADHLVQMDDHWKIIDQVKQITGSGPGGEPDPTGARPGELCDVVIECVGKQWPLDLAAELTKERGRLVIAGFHQDGPRTFNGFLWNWRGLDVINAHERDPKVYLHGIDEAITAVEAGDLDPDALFTHRFSLDQLTEALRMTQERPEGFMKALIEMER